MDPAHEIGENLTITDRSQLLSITPEQAKKIKSLRIEDQVIDGYFISDFFQWSLFFLRISIHCIFLNVPLIDLELVF